MNVRLLRKIARVIQEKPKLFDMTRFSYEKKCGTSHCIGGWAQHFGKTLDAAAALGINEYQARRLFYVEMGGVQLWPDRFIGRKKKGMSTTESMWYPTPRQAAARIEHFIKTKGAE